MNIANELSKFIILFGTLGAILLVDQDFMDREDVMGTVDSEVAKKYEWMCDTMALE